MKINAKGLVLGSGLIAVSLIAGCTASTTTAGSVYQAPAAGKSGKSVTIGYVNWAEDVAVTTLWKQLLENHGYQVTAKSLDAGPLFVGLSQGGLDFFFDTWLPYTHKAYVDKYSSDLTDLGVWYQGDAKIGLVVPNYVTIDSIDQLNQSADKFQKQIVGIDAGAGEMATAKKAVDDYQLKLQLVSGSEAAMLTTLKRSIAGQQWVVVTGWSPHWMFANYPLKYLTDPKGTFGKSEQIHTEANGKWASSNPQAVNWLKNFKLTSDQLGKLEDDVNSAASPDEGVQKWIHDNRTLTDSWFN
ncbi:MAG: ABC-type proline/glycine betaine transport system, periplasmic component [Bacilli bacterium]|nr:ABC-type proline/glycine betaine transport system, periplasmic component [Bacilli bacterium]